MKVMFALVLLMAAPSNRAADSLGASAASLVEVRGVTLGWAGISLGASRQSLQTLLRRELVVNVEPFLVRGFVLVESFALGIAGRRP